MKSNELQVRSSRKRWGERSQGNTIEPSNVCYWMFFCIFLTVLSLILKARLFQQLHADTMWAKEVWQNQMQTKNNPLNHDWLHELLNMSYFANLSLTCSKWIRKKLRKVHVETKMAKKRISDVNIRYDAWQRLKKFYSILKECFLFNVCSCIFIWMVLPQRIIKLTPGFIF